MTRIPTLALIATALLATSSSANEILDGWWPEVGNALMGLGVPEEQIRGVFNRIETIDVMAVGPGSWVHEFKAAGDVYLAQAQQIESAGGSRDQVIAAYERANGYYNTARFPSLFTAERTEAYRLQMSTFQKIVEHKGVALQVVNIPFEGKQIVGHFYPGKRSPSPVIVWSGGIDGWKDAGLDFKQTLLEEGFAVFAVDLPGTGESQSLLEANSERIYSRVFDYLKTRSDVDGNRMAVYFGSFSGVFAIKLALTDPDVKAAVNHSGGIHLFFTKPRDMPSLLTSIGMRRAATIHAMGLDGQDMDRVRERFAAFSLARQGLLKSTPAQAPLLSIYGTEDVLMPIEDLRYLQDSGVKTDALVYEGAGHMAWEHASDHRPKTIAWLKKQLNMQDTPNAKQ